VMETRKAAKPDYMMNVQVIKADDKSVLPMAKIVVITFSEDDQELNANDEGIASFSISEESDYMIVGSKDGYVGMLAGTGKKGERDPNAIYIIETFAEDKKSIPIVAQIFDNDGDEIEVADVSVIEKSSLKEVSAQFDKGVLAFLGEKGKQYDVKVKRDGNTSTHIHTVSDSTDLIEKLAIILPAGTPDEERNHRNAPIPTIFNKSLIVFKTDRGKSKVYLNDNNSFSEVIEREDQLYIQRDDSTIHLGKGMLSNISYEKEILRRLRLTESDVIRLENIYFDFNKALLDANDKMELEKVNYVLKNFPSVQLVINAHADDRGQDSYNLTLSKRRAKAVGTFLLKRGVAKNRISQNAMGETLPEVACGTRECTEEEHQKNRRVEFVLREPGGAAEDTHITVNKNRNGPLVSKTLSYQEILAKYGDNKAPNLKFKIALGVYRFNPSLAFDNLKDLGKVEALNVSGITYYFLSEYFSMNEAEVVRKKVIERGIKDAYITFYYNDETVKIQEVVSFLQKSDPHTKQEPSISHEGKSAF
jgi:outer membrane protein OmpA-like peptidoglycan-associated protein